MAVTQTVSIVNNNGDTFASSGWSMLSTDDQ